MDALGLRMTSLLLRGPARSSVADVVGWFGAMQAQEVNSVLWSLGCRLPGMTLEQIKTALEDRTVLRTWPMRGTVHLVPAADAHWMLDLMGVRMLAGAAKRRQTLGLDEKTAERAVEILGTALTGGKRLTRAECLAALTEGGVEVSGQRGYHLLWYAAQRGVTAIAPHVGKDQTFVLLDDWVAKPRRPSREEALAWIAERYFRGHGPATRKDFVGWTGLTMTDCKAGIAAAGPALTTVDVDGVQMIMPSSLAALEGPAWHALAGFDEYLLGYKGRALMVAPGDLDRIVPGGNGMFRATLVRDGRAVGVWTRAITRKGVTVTVEPLIDFTARDREQIVAALEPYAAFLGLPLTVKNP